MRRNWVRLAGLLLWVTGAVLAAQPRLNRYILVLDTPPVAATVASRAELRGPAAIAREAAIGRQQDSLTATLRARGVKVFGSTRLLGNALFVAATAEQALDSFQLPGVIAVHCERPMKRQLDKAIDLVNVPAAWSSVGGVSNAGAGVKIGVLDSGIDISHPAFQDTTLRTPAGFPKCSAQSDCTNYTNSKVIVARSYVPTLVYAQDPSLSRPDDVSARDRVGHGTAVAMVAAGGRVSGPAATITGVAPKAWLGSYKIVGSPGVNDYTYSDVIQAALNDAVSDGMDVAVLPYGTSADYGPTSPQAAQGQYDDYRSSLIENAAKLGLTIVLPAGNSGDVGSQLPSLGTIETPGIAYSGITVGATTNSHQFFQTLYVNGSGVPNTLAEINALFGNGPQPTSPLTAPLRDVTKVGDDGFACSPMTNGSLTGTIALIQRGNCALDVKVINASKAGAYAAVIYNQSSDFIAAVRGLEQTGIPMALIGATNGANLKSFLASKPDTPGTLDTAMIPVNAMPDEVAYFSSQGPVVGALSIKPDLAAVGTDLYLATQTFDPNSELYDRSGFTAAQGTSFAAPMVAGAVALVKQKNPGFRAGQLKSAVVNTASPDNIYDYDYDNNRILARVNAIGAGKLNAANAVATNVTVEPANISFGDVSRGMPTVALTITNTSSNTLNLALGIQPRDTDTRARVTLSQANVSVAAGRSTTVNVTLAGSTPLPGSYEGVVTITGGAVALRVPYLYLMGDGVPFSIYPLVGYDFVGNAGEPVPSGSCFDSPAPPGGCLEFKVIDRYGVPVRNATVVFGVNLGGGSIERATATTDPLGIGAARAILGRAIGDQEFYAKVGNQTVYFSGRARIAPVIQSDGVINGATLRTGAIAPGSYISILGRGLAETARIFSTPYLPLSLSAVSVSFDVAGANPPISLPGRISYVSDSQINVQVPWELAGKTSAQVKVSLGDFSTPLVTVPITSYAPGFFEYPDSSGPLMIAALDENYRLIGSANPAQRGHSVQLYSNGLGPVSNTPPTGEVSQVPPLLSQCQSTPTVSIGGKPAQVQFCGLTPGTVGLYQVNVLVPQDTPTGLQQVLMTVGGATAKTSNLVIQ